MQNFNKDFIQQTVLDYDLDFSIVELEYKLSKNLKDFYERLENIISN